MSVAGERPREVRANTVLGDFFEVLGVRPVAGRLLSAAETGLGSDRFVVVISERLWDDLFQRSANVAGRTLQANGHTLRVIGVAGDGFAGPERGVEIDMWLPFSSLIPLVSATEEALLSRRSTMHDELVVRLASGGHAAAAEGEVATLLRNLVSNGVENADYLRDLTPVLFSGLRVPPLARAHTYASLRILGGVVLLVLLLACANAANLLLFRSLERGATWRYRGRSAHRRAASRGHG